MAAAAVCAAAGLAWVVLTVNTERSCVVRDTPYFDTCTPDDAARLKLRIASNPGDANAYVGLARAAVPAATPALLDAAKTLAPAEPNLMMARAVAALQRNDLAAAVEPLVELVEYRDVPDAAAILGRMIAGGEGARLLPYVKPGTRWLNRVLAQMPQSPASTSAALPLVVQALKSGVLDAAGARPFMRQLKSAGLWPDAYGLWLALQGGGPLPTLYNGNFDHAFRPDGFDWEVLQTGPASRAGAIVERKGAEERAAVLEARFNGRAFESPLVRQYLFIPPGKYRLVGDFQSRQLRMEKGLAWSVRCTGRTFEAGRSQALADSQGLWRPFSFEFTIPRDCGAVAALQLETFTPVEASLGARGRMAFDALSIEKVQFP